MYIRVEKTDRETHTSILLSISRYKGRAYLGRGNN